MVWVLGFFTFAGYNFTFWSLVGCIRYVIEKFAEPKRVKKHKLQPVPIRLKDLAAIIPAHNEEVSIRRTLNALLKVLPRKNIYVASDYSTDKTIPIIRALGVRSIDIKPNIGKAKALVQIMKEYGLLKSYKAILINDADSIVQPSYIAKALQVFRDKDVAAITPRGTTMWRKYKPLEMFFIAYRVRLWRVLQLGVRFGQMWRLTNVSYITPGSYSIYRTDALKKIEIDAPGLVIEDFNMTFEMHKKKLGKAVYCPDVYAIHQDPYNFRDYVKQLKRWNVGFFQTIKRNGVWPSIFWIFTAAFLIEITLYAVFVLFLPIIIVLFAVNNFEPISIPYLYARLTIIDILVGVFLIDYLTTIVAAALERKPIILLYGLGFFFLRYVDSLIYLYSIPKAFLTRSAGTWQSPVRKR